MCVPQRPALNVLWAGRLDRQKRIDLLAQIAAHCRDLPYHFHVHGSAVLEQFDTRKLAAPNVTYHGPFDGFASLPLEQFDVYLYTSQWDGLPNILLEAMAAGLPIIASKVGGVGELIESGETGCAIEPYDDVDAFVAALGRIARDPELGERWSRQGRRRLEEHHSWASFAAVVRNAPGYVRGSPGSPVLAPKGRQ